MNRRALLWLAAVFALVGCTSQDVEGGSTGDISAEDASYTDLAEDAGNSTFVPADQDATESDDGASAAKDAAIEPETTDPDCEPGTGCFGDPCEDGLDCFSGVCGLHLGGYVCSKLCDATCPDGWECKLSGTGADAYSVCVSRFTHLCQPCGTQGDCSSDTKQNACVSYGTDGSEGSFCGGACDDDTPCPVGYLCQEVSVQGGGVSGQCVPESGECACSEVAISLSMGTECSVTNDLGACSGVRSCGPSGLSPCDALIPGDDLCDGVDNDCDGQTDEGFEAVTCGLGACEHTVDSCVGGETQTCDPLEGATEEVCNGVDDDCDGEADDDLAPVTCGLGACEHTVDSCVDGETQTCDPLEGATEEVCSGVDDDCNGEVDDGLAPVTCGVGPCEHTVDSCVDGETQTCDPLEGSSPEICDGVDNDCDGQPDQGLGETTCGQGVCEHTVDNCHEGSPQFCDPFLGATLEQCNGLDDDCDGDVDEDQGQLTCGQGACAHTVDSCLDGVAQSCDPLEGSSDEVCDGVDNDCDGDTDEDQAPLSCGLGVCQHVASACVGGVTQSCDPLEGAASESCNGLDDDCDGDVDQGLGQTTCGLGVCAQTIHNCVNGAPQFCDPFLGATLEQCNGLDDDCDGEVDEDLGETPCGVGACAHIISNCLEGAEQICDPLEGAGAEICNGLDDDCDGEVDEDQAPLTCGTGLCAHTAPSCLSGQVQTCDPLLGATAEVCNGLDDDCDGTADEELGESTCGLGACANTVTNCVDGAHQFCDPFQGAKAEVCDGIDDDCDGEVDDNLGFITCGLGVCQITVDLCVNGEVQLCVPLDAASPEVCNGLDDDCDGEVDEDLGQTSCGLSGCAHTIDNCVDGEVQICDPFEGAVPEVCNGLDDDCDGAPDEELGETTCGLGQCTHTIDNCVDAQTQVCDPLEGAGVEVCDALDNDCDGEIDEELGETSCGLSGCAHTIDNCVGGEVQVCDPFEGALPEVCNGLDDDCNGAIDDGLGQTSCGVGQCAHTIDSCVGGEVQVCDPLEGATPEVCNGLDDNCQGAVDEDLGQTSCGQGVCAQTIDNCVGGVDQICDPFAGATPEICNGEDTDCDGAVDEDTAGICQICNGVGGLSNKTKGTDCGGGNVCDGSGSCVDPCTVGGIVSDCKGLRDLCPDLGDGSYVIAPDGSPLTVQCEMGISEGGWTQMTQAFLNTMSGGSWEYLYTLNGGWYRSPPTPLIWNWGSFQGVAGTYAYGQGDNQTGSFGCNTNEGGGWGIGCSNGGGNQWKCIPHYEKDPGPGRSKVCQDKPDVFGVGACGSGAQIWVRQQ